MLCNIKPVPFHESDKHIFAKIPGGSGPPVPPSGSAHEYGIENSAVVYKKYTRALASVYSSYTTAGSFLSHLDHTTIFMLYMS